MVEPASLAGHGSEQYIQRAANLFSKLRDRMGVPVFVIVVSLVTTTATIWWLLPKLSQENCVCLPRFLGEACVMTEQA